MKSADTAGAAPAHKVSLAKIDSRPAVAFSATATAQDKIGERHSNIGSSIAVATSIVRKDGPR
jgi:hypothetical protein